jgi:tRNA threonylcarbamoyladenosine biosynthesis protein TsaB
MICLAVNTATTVLSVALTHDEEVLHYFETPEIRNQGNLVMSHMQAALAKHELKYGDLGIIAAVTGPGSFTGIRLGLAAARGAALAAGVPVTGVSSFDMFGEGADLVAVESWRDELYFRFRDQAPVNVTPEEMAKQLPAGLTVAGDAAEKILPLLKNARRLDAAGNAVAAARIAVRQKEWLKPVPFYVREADISQPKQKRV